MYCIGHSHHPNYGFLASTFLFFVPHLAHLYPPRPGSVVTAYAAQYAKIHKKMQFRRTVCLQIFWNFFIGNWVSKGLTIYKVKKFFQKMLIFSLWANHASTITCRHIFCTIFSRLCVAQCGSTTSKTHMGLTDGWYRNTFLYSIFVL